jgi:DNA topoisomerase-2
MSTKPIYTQLDPISHILKRPDMYCGSPRMAKSQEYVVSQDKLVTRKINSCPALLRIFIEVLSNAVDNVERSKNTSDPCKKIMIKLDSNTSEITIWNDGQIIPIEFNDEGQCYNHTMIFGRLLSGSNYDDDENRTVSGRNGLGSKLCNVMSSYFNVEACDHNIGKKFTQTWTNNMRETKGPIVKANKCKQGYTQVKWIADMKYFGIDAYSEDVVSVFHKYAYDAALITGVTVYFNDVRIKLNTLYDYSKMFNTTTNNTRITLTTDTCEILLTPQDSKESGFEHVSFVNGNFTKSGGVHVDSWCETLFRPIVEYVNGKSKTKSKINITDVKNVFRIFIITRVTRPEFDSQNKHRLESPNIKSEASDASFKKILKWSVIDDLKNILKSKEVLTVKKSDTSTRSFQKIEGYDRANNSGGKKSMECTLILCEGLSAKTYAVAGINKGLFGKRGRDWFGILPLTGKLLNVTNATCQSINSNKVICNILNVIGLKHNLDYSIDGNFNSLNYGKVVIMTDADNDGIHIEGLLLNMFNTLFPALLRRTESFVSSMKTPIARIQFKNKKNKDILFYDEIKFINWMKDNSEHEKITVKYYKGLGTTKIEDVKDTFGSKLVYYDYDKDANKNIRKIFSKENTGHRKDWISQHNPNDSKSVIDKDQQNFNMDISNFMLNEMVKFSVADCNRSIPNVIDGLKEAQRKILYCVKKKNLVSTGPSLKVAQLAGYTAEHSNYHHGEQNLNDTIIAMANDFVGSNNIPLLFRDGQFGTRLDGGSDSASARYIYTKMEKLTEFIFMSEDDNILTYRYDDGDKVEPEFYAPIIPMILVNGSVGIGTGWSSNIPSYNPSDIITSVRQWISFNAADDCVLYDDDGRVIMSMLDEIKPWYNNYKGVITKVSDDKYTSIGISSIENNKITINELPIGTWTNKFKEKCEDLIIQKHIKKMKNYSTPEQPNFILDCITDPTDVQNKLKLTTHISTNNMVAFNADQQIRKYNCHHSIIDEFCKFRLLFYKKRKEYQLTNIKAEIELTIDKIKFITLYQDQSIIHGTEDNIIAKLEKLNVKKKNGTYNFLFDMPIRSLNADKLKQLKQKQTQLEGVYSELHATSETAIWLRDLDRLEQEYNK